MNSFGFLPTPLFFFPTSPFLSLLSCMYCATPPDGHIFHDLIHAFYTIHESNEDTIIGSTI